MDNDLLETIEHATGDDAQSSIIVLHGLGADGNDFVPVIDQMDLSAVGPCRFIFPHAPVMPVTISGGMPMRAWYDILGIDLSRREDETGLRRSIRRVHALIDRERQRGVAAERIVLAGFSQGCAMTLLSGLRYPHRLAGLIGLSGYLPLADTAESERHGANHETPIFMAHGSYDPVVPIARAIAARDLLLRLNHPLEWHEYQMPHSVCAPEVAAINRFIVSVLNQGRSASLD